MIVFFLLNECLTQGKETISICNSLEDKQDKTRQDKTRQDKTRKDKTRQDKTRQDKTIQDIQKEMTKRDRIFIITLHHLWQGQVPKTS